MVRTERLADRAPTRGIRAGVLKNGRNGSFGDLFRAYVHWCTRPSRDPHGLNAGVPSARVEPVRLRSVSRLRSPPATHEFLPYCPLFDVLSDRHLGCARSNFFLSTQHSALTYNDVLRVAPYTFLATFNMRHKFGSRAGQRAGCRLMPSQVRDLRSGLSLKFRNRTGVCDAHR